MKEKTKLRIVQILCVVSLLITVFSIQRTYAKYYEQIGTTYATNIKRWVINVNNSNIHEGDALTEIMTPVLIEDENMNSNNTLVPGRKGYFEFLIDYTKVDVAFRFQFDIQQLNKLTTVDPDTEETITQDNPLEDFEIYGYEIIETDAETGAVTKTETYLETPNNLSELNQVIDPDNTEHLDINGNKKRVIRILFRWNDANADTDDTDVLDGMNNFEDTQYTGETNTAEDADGLHKVLKYQVKITFTQTI